MRKNEAKRLAKSIGESLDKLRKEFIDPETKEEECGWLKREPTEQEIDDTCLSFDHSFGLLPKEDKKKIRFYAKEWLHSWKKTYDVY